ncbi:MAG: divergent polysaccharide deacetylase family protein [Alphaproteobacteria bacterium]|nr:divergent polysaccharide deacetylase family protein [Alphaproteobacteria bacterium]
MKKSVVFILVLLMIITAEMWALYWHHKNPTPVQYQLATIELDLPKPDMSGIKPFLFETKWAEDINRELDKIQAVIDNSLNDDFTQSLSSYSARRKRAAQIRKERLQGLEEYRQRAAQEAAQIKGEYLGNNRCLIQNTESECVDGLYRLDDHCIACYAGICAGTNCATATDAAKHSKPAADLLSPSVAEKNFSAEEATLDRTEGIIDAEPRENFESKPVASKNDGKAQIAVIIDDVGLSVPFTNQLVQIKEPVTVAFLPYGASNKAQVLKLKNAGFEVMLHAPMMPHVRASLAPNTLSPKMSKSEIKTMFTAMLERFADTGIVGANNHMGSAFTEDAEAMSVVIEQLKAENMFFLDSKTSSKSVAKSVCRKLGVPYIARDVFLDNEKDYTKIMQQFAVTERIAKKRGYAVAIGHPYKQTLQALKDWENNLNSRGIELVPLSYLVQKNN